MFISEAFNKSKFDISRDNKILKKSKFQIYLKANHCREELKKQTELYLKYNYQFSNIRHEVLPGSTFPQLVIDDKYKIGFKNFGITQTTTSVITEILPVIGIHKKLPRLNTINFCISYLEEGPKKCFVEDQDRLNAIKHLKDFKEFPLEIRQRKISDGRNIYRYIMRNYSNIKSVFWTYRKKPFNISNKDQSDLVLRFFNESLLGISIKSGTENSNEPKLNTSVKKLYKEFNLDYDSLYSRTSEELSGCLYPFDVCSISSRKKDYLRYVRNLQREDHDPIYHEISDFIISDVVKQLSKVSIEDLRNYCKKNIIRDSLKSIVLKGVNGSHVELDESEIMLNSIIKKMFSFKVLRSESAKKKLIIEIDKKYQMEFYIRSSQGCGLAEVPNLKVVYTQLIVIDK